MKKPKKSTAVELLQRQNAELKADNDAVNDRNNKLQVRLDRLSWLEGLVYEIEAALRRNRT